MEGTGESKQFWETGNIGNQDFDFEEQGNTAIYFKGTGNPWEDLIGCIQIKTLGWGGGHSDITWVTMFVQKIE